MTRRKHGGVNYTLAEFMDLLVHGVQSSEAKTRMSGCGMNVATPAHKRKTMKSLRAAADEANNFDATVRNGMSQPAWAAALSAAKQQGKLDAQQLIQEMSSELDGDSDSDDSMALDAGVDEGLSVDTSIEALLRSILNADGTTAWEYPSEPAAWRNRFAPGEFEAHLWLEKASPRPGAAPPRADAFPIDALAAERAEEESAAWRDEQEELGLPTYADQARALPNPDAPMPVAPPLAACVRLAHPTITHHREDGLLMACSMCGSVRHAAAALSPGCCHRHHPRPAPPFALPASARLPRPSRPPRPPATPRAN